jgi:uncharacterized RDD family membrane protein YckC
VPAGAGADAYTRPSFPYRSSIKRRLVSMVYESLLLAGFVFFAALLFLGLSGGSASGLPRHAFQVYLFLIIGLYFVASWRRRGQTLAMKTWKLRLVGANGERISLLQALLRYVCAWPSLALGGIGILYALFDRDRQFLHDRLAGTKIVRDQELAEGK